MAISFADVVSVFVADVSALAFAPLHEAVSDAKAAPKARAKIVFFIACK